MGIHSNITLKCHGNLENYRLANYKSVSKLRNFSEFNNS